MAKFSDLA